MPPSELFQITPEVRACLEQCRAIVALESTVIAHGLPQPQNLETARRCERMIRECGATPATIAILDGKLCVGLSDEQLRSVATDPDIRKISIRDLPVAVSRGLNGATTVASSIWVAARAGLKVFATGGIGGVHRGTNADISADLPQLARTPIVVVCSGAKIVLNLPATREWLETHGVTVVGYGCDEMPAFYSRRSGLAVDITVDSPEEIVRLVDSRDALGINSALLVTVPVPKAAELSGSSMEAVLEGALEEARDKGISGSDVTPFLLSRMTHGSEGATLAANIALLENNARIASEIAVALVAG